MQLCIWCIYHFQYNAWHWKQRSGPRPNRNMWLHVCACVHTSNFSNWLLHADSAGANTVSVDRLRWECCCSSAASCELEGSNWACRSKPHSSRDTAQLYRVQQIQDRLHGPHLPAQSKHSDLSHTGRRLARFKPRLSILDFVSQPWSGGKSKDKIQNEKFGFKAH